MTGFANVEEDFADVYVGQKLMPFTSFSSRQFQDLA